MSSLSVTVNQTHCSDPDDHSDYGMPLKWIGLYVAAATLVCFFCIAADLFHSFKRKKLWIVPKQFRFNAATLTVLGVATKIASDLTEPMPGRLEQSVKLQSVNLISIVMVHAMSSFGEMGSMGLISNMVGLGILVISTYIDICFQVSTGLIGEGFVLLLSSSVMLFIFLIAISHSLTIPVANSVLEKQYNSKHVGIMRSISSSTGHAPMRVSVNQLEDCIYKFWLMALTSSPDYALLSSEMSYLSTLLCWFGIIANVIPMTVLPLLFPDEDDMESMPPRLWYSHYRWSIIIIFCAQLAAVVVGVITCLFKFWNSKYDSRSWNWRSLLKMQRFYTQKLMEWREAALPLHVSSRKAMMMEQLIKDFTVVFLLWFQYTMIFLCKIALLFSTFRVTSTLIIVLLVTQPFLFYPGSIVLLLQLFAPVLLRGLLRIVGRVYSAMQRLDASRTENMEDASRTENMAEIMADASRTENMAENRADASRTENTADASRTENMAENMADASRTENMPSDMSDYVLQMEGEVESVEDITQRWQNYPRRWVRSGRSNCLVDLLHLVVGFATPSEGFPRARSLFNDSVPLVDSRDELPSSWSLPVVTLASVMYATRGNNNLDVSLLVRIVGRCIKHLKLVDGSLDLKSPARLQEAADLVWQGLHLHGRWLDVNFGKGSHAQTITSIEIIQHLNTNSRCKALRFGNNDPVEWPPKILAANCMYRITGAILKAYEEYVTTSEGNTDNSVFLKQQLQSVLADVLGACFSSLPLALLKHCSSGKFGAREDRVQDAAIIFGETEELLKYIEDNGNAESYPEDPRFLDNWCRRSGHVV